MKHANEILQLFHTNRLRGKLTFKAFGDLLQARLPVEHLQDGEFLLFEAKVLKPHGVLHHPIDAPLIALTAGLEVGPGADCELP